MYEFKRQYWQTSSGFQITQFITHNSTSFKSTTTKFVLHSSEGELIGTYKGRDELNQKLSELGEQVVTAIPALFSKWSEEAKEFDKMITRLEQQEKES